MKKRKILNTAALAAVMCVLFLMLGFSAQAKKNPGGVYIFADTYCDDRDINSHIYLSLDKGTEFSAEVLREDGCYPTGTLISEYTDGSLTGKHIYILSGDINCDGVIDILDVTVFELNLGGSYGFDFISEAAADINRDGLTGIEDYSETVNLALSGGAYYEEKFLPEGINTTDYTPSEIAANKYIFAIGKTKPEYAVAVFNSSYTSVTVSANGRYSDGRTADFSADSSPLSLHAATLKTVIFDNGITSIGARLCRSCTAVKSIKLPATCRDVGTRAFYGNSGAASLDLGYVRTIGTAAFADCTGLCGALNIPDSCIFIGDYAFAALGADNMNFNALNLGSSVRYIGAGAFQLCVKAANELVLPDTLEVIGDFAFNHCFAFKNAVLRIPASVTHIGGNTVNHALYGAQSVKITPDNYREYKYADSSSHVFYDFAANHLKEFEVDPGSCYFKSANGVLLSKNGKRLICIPKGFGSSYTMPEGVVNADEMSMPGITELTLANSFIIEPWQSAPRTQINFQNTLTDALYLNSLICRVHLKAGNRRYTESNGSIYTNDDRRALVHLYLEQGKTVNIQNGCTAIDGAFLYDARIKPNITGAVINIPSSVMSITNYSSESYPDEGELDGINRYISEKTVTVKVNSANPYIKNAVGGKVVYR